MRAFRKTITIEIDVEAMQYDGNNGFVIRKWTDGIVFESPVLEPIKNNPTGAYIIIKTSHGTDVGLVNDWVIKNTNGTFSLCNNSVFEEMYRPIGN